MAVDEAGRSIFATNAIIIAAYVGQIGRKIIFQSPYIYKFKYNTYTSIRTVSIYSIID